MLLFTTLPALTATTQAILNTLAVCTETTWKCFERGLCIQDVLRNYWGFNLAILSHTDEC